MLIHIKKTISEPGYIYHDTMTIIMHTYSAKYSFMISVCGQQVSVVIFVKFSLRLMLYAYCERGYKHRAPDTGHRALGAHKIYLYLI